MVSMNNKMNIPQMTNIMKEFQKQSDMMDMKEEVMGDAIDDVMAGEEDEEEEEELVSSVLDEIGLHLSGQVEIEKKGITLKTKETSKEDEELQARLDNWRRD